MRRLSSGLALSAILALVLGPLLASPASAEQSRIGLSRDGRTWRPALTAPLFDPAFRWVPGDVLTKSFFVRNQSPEDSDALLSLQVVNTAVDALLTTGDLAVEARADEGAWRSIAAPGVHDLSERALSPGQSSRVEVRVGFDAASTNASQSLPFRLRFSARLDQDTSQRVSAVQAGSPSTALGLPRAARGPLADLLPNTGGPAARILASGVSLLVLGTLIAALRRRKEEPHHAHD